MLEVLGLSYCHFTKKNSKQRGVFKGKIELNFRSVLFFIKQGLRWNYWMNFVINKEVDYVIRYEELVSHPEVTLRELCNMVKLPYFPQLIDPSLRWKDAILKKDEVRQFHPLLDQDINKERAEAWKKVLPKWAIVVVEVVAKEGMEFFNYKPVYVSFASGNIMF